LTFGGEADAAKLASENLLATADATDNPHSACWALNAYGWARLDSDPIAAYEAQRRALSIARSSGNRQVESSLTIGLARLAIVHGETREVLEFVATTVHRYHDSASFSFLHISVAVLAAFFDRLGRYEPAAVMSGFASTPITDVTFPEFDTTILHLRQALGDDAYDARARRGEKMTNATAANYALEQIDLARAELK
jgi:hypothetical protein